jgi:hypothetical protein
MTVQNDHVHHSSGQLPLFFAAAFVLLVFALTFQL